MNVIKDTEKRCPVCERVFPRHSFRTKGGRASYCDKCWRDYCRERQRAYRIRKFNKKESPHA
jgi:hypothetical protein